MDLLDYWDEYPPAHLTLQGIAAGLSGVRIGKSAAGKTVDDPNVKRIKTAEDVFEVMGSINRDILTPETAIGVIHGR